MAFDSFEVVGGQKIGDKAALLREYQPLIREVGLHTPATTVLASEMVRAEAGNLNEATIAALEQVSHSCADTPVLVVRSSAEGDGSGNGVYESRFATNATEYLVDEASLVIASFSSEGAADFRRQANLGTDFALMIQPVIGQDLQSDKHGKNFGPYLSGYGYTSTRKLPDGYLNVVAGIGGGVSRKGGQFVSPQELDRVAQFGWTDFHNNPQAGSFFDYLDAVRDAILSGHVRNEATDFQSYDMLRNWSAVRGDYASAQYLHQPAGSTAYEYLPNSVLNAGLFDDDGERFIDVLRGFVPGQLFDAMFIMEQRAGHPLYIEWALCVDGAEVQPVIVQIAPAEQTARTKLEANIKGTELAEGELLSGHGVYNIKKIAIVTGTMDMAHLRAFNQDPANEGYLLMFNEGRALSITPNKLVYQDCSKAGILIEVAANGHDPTHYHGDIMQHLFGASRQTNKVVGRIEKPSYDRPPAMWCHVADDGELWQAPGKAEPSDHSSGVQLLEGNFTVYADSKDGRIIITEES